ncbi:hypothetical protein [Natronomonas pharaonis]|uniref:hypothetical protein n=1 Tax=Natronomonas pharaonis TaxID=2257 RepID=UPI000677D994|nr:hypothetical protein [Natronomonas pharaonis]
MPSLEIEYHSHDSVTEVVARLQYCLESISRTFDEWESPRAEGPGLYFAVIADRGYGDYADPMGDYRWPTETCPTVYDEAALLDASWQVGMDADGAVVVGVDGHIEPQLVRFRNPAFVATEEIAYENWMGARHVSYPRVKSWASTRSGVSARATVSS